MVHSFIAPLLLLLITSTLASPAPRPSRTTKRNTPFQIQSRPNAHLDSELRKLRMHQFPRRLRHGRIPSFASPLNLNSIQRQVEGFVGDSCSLSSPCISPRVCIDPDVMPLELCSRSSTECFCNYGSKKDKLCSCENPCPSGERCVHDQSGENTCLSSNIPGDDIQCVNPNHPRFNFEACSETEQCAEGHSCLYPLLDGYQVPCDGQGSCYCLADDFDDLLCSCKSPQCPEGEKCVSVNSVSLCSSIALNEPDVACPSETPQPVPTSIGKKFSEEPCTTSAECAAPRVCSTFASGGFLKECDGERDCTCIPREYEDHVCSCKNSDCLPGDTCSFKPAEAYCISEALQPHPLLCNNSITSITSPLFEDGTATTDPMDKNRNKFNYEICRTDDECAGNRECVDENDRKCIGSRMCTCWPRIKQFHKCSCENPRCMKGDVCGFHPDYLYCVSTNIATHPNRCPPPSESNAAVMQPLPNETPPLSPQPIQANPSLLPIPTNNACIDAKALANFHSDDLIFKNHAVSRVLCDQSGSCATPGHIVQYMGSVVMMKRYCERVGCEERVMEVNSPRYQRGIRIASKTNGLEFTVFAARFETRGEEALLSAAVRVGL